MPPRRRRLDTGLPGDYTRQGLFRRLSIGHPHCPYDLWDLVYFQVSAGHDIWRHSAWEVTSPRLRRAAASVGFILLFHHHPNQTDLPGCNTGWTGLAGWLALTSRKLQVWMPAFFATSMGYRVPGRPGYIQASTYSLRRSWLVDLRLFCPADQEIQRRRWHHSLGFRHNLSRRTDGPGVPTAAKHHMNLSSPTWIIEHKRAKL